MMNVDMNLTDAYTIEHYIDTFALGHYARVLSARDRRSQQTVAFKVMRPEHLGADGDMRWEFRAFGNEADILAALESSPHSVNLHDCGFVSTIGEAPAGGEVQSYGRDVRAFSTSLHDYALKGWRPYLALENLPRNTNLFYAMKPSQGGQRRRLPTEEGLTLALQFAHLLALAHAQSIVYLDHKLEHVYWDGVTLRVIDFNSSRQLTGGAGDGNEYAKDIHNLCVGILYPIFTGMSPQKGTLLPQPGGMQAVESRYEDVRELDFGMEPTLSPAIQDLLQRGAQMSYRHIDEFMADLQTVAARHGRDFPGTRTTSASRTARDHMREGLKKLREGETAVREARDLFREALILDDIPEDLEAELRRMVKHINAMLNQRVIP